MTPKRGSGPHQPGVDRRGIALAVGTVVVDGHGDPGLPDLPVDEIGISGSGAPMINFIPAARVLEGLIGSAGFVT
jgi:hypothetical protein